jgi:hypothetical protein
MLMSALRLVSPFAWLFHSAFIRKCRMQTPARMIVTAVGEPGGQCIVWTGGVTPLCGSRPLYSNDVDRVLSVKSGNLVTIQDEDIGTLWPVPKVNLFLPVALTYPN